MIKNIRSKSMLLLLCAIATTNQVQSDCVRDTVEIVALGTSAIKNAAQTIYLLKDLQEGDVEECFDKANTVTWDLVVPLIVAWLATQTYGDKYNSNGTLYEKGLVLAKGTTLAITGGAGAYLLGSLPKQLLKQLFCKVVEVKKSLEKKLK